MMRFSERQGIAPRKSIQKDDVNVELRTKLWNRIELVYWKCFSARSRGYALSSNHRLQKLIYQVWMYSINRPVGQLTSLPIYKILNEIELYFFNCKWYEVYDFIESIIDYGASQDQDDEKFVKYCNAALAEELSAYRFVDKKIIEVTSDIEIAEIEGALKATESVKPVHTHLNEALALLSKKPTPDYRNSIKEAISAVEAVCKLIANDPTTTLGQALNIIESKGVINLHSDLKEGFKKLYHYTSDASGIRHALMGAPNLDIEDARFMLVACSAFVNYLVIKADKSKIKI